MSTPRLLTPEPIRLPGKYTSEVKSWGFKWTKPLAGDIIISATMTKLWGHINIDAQTFVGDQTVVRLSGGKAGTDTLISFIVTTGAGDQLEARALIACSDSQP